jgi:hypothetical protein
MLPCVQKKQTEQAPVHVGINHKNQIIKSLPKKWMYSEVEILIQRANRMWGGAEGPDEYIIS